MFTKPKIPSEIGRLFWDTDLTSLDIWNNRVFIIERILNMGNGASLKWLWQTYNEETIREAVKNSRNLSRKTAGCWQNYFGLERKEMRCFSTFSTKHGFFF